MKTKNEFLQLGGVLLIITAVVALLLGYFNSLTADVIAANVEAKKLMSMQNVMPEAGSFELLDVAVPDDSVITEVQKGFFVTGEPAGYCFTLKPEGYGGELTVVAGVDLEGKVTGVDIIEHSETPGLGANADNPQWLKQFIGKSGELTVVKSNPGDSQIQAVTSATRTSRAVTGAVSQALAFVETLEKEGK